MLHACGKQENSSNPSPACLQRQMLRSVYRLQVHSQSYGEIYFMLVCCFIINVVVIYRKSTTKVNKDETDFGGAVLSVSMW